MIASQLNIFLSYADDDEQHAREFSKRIGQLRLANGVKLWYRACTQPGEDWERESDKYLEHANIVILAVTPDFFASKRCFDVELPRAIERHKNGSARVVPLIIRPAFWEKEPLARLHPIPTRGKAITSWQNADEAWLDVVHSLERIALDCDNRNELMNENSQLKKDVERLATVEHELLVECERLRGELLRFQQDSTGVAELASAQKKIAELTVELGMMHRDLFARQQTHSQVLEHRQTLQAELATLREELRESKRTAESLKARLYVRAELIARGTDIDASDSNVLLWHFCVKNIGDGEIRLLKADINWKFIGQTPRTTMGDLFAEHESQNIAEKPVLAPGCISTVYVIKIDTQILDKRGAKHWLPLLRPVVRVAIEGVRVNLQSTTQRLLPREDEMQGAES